MSLHPPKTAPRASRVELKAWGGFTVSRIFARRPRVLRLEVSKPQGSTVAGKKR